MSGSVMRLFFTSNREGYEVVIVCDDLAWWDVCPK